MIRQPSQPSAGARAPAPNGRLHLQAPRCLTVMRACAKRLPWELRLGTRRFLMAAPVNAVLLWSVPPGVRPFALAAAEFSQHALGDIPSPPALGWLQVRSSACFPDWGS